MNWELWKGKWHVVPQNTLLIAQHGAGAKKSWGPAPLTIINILRVRILSFSSGAGNPEKTAPAPSRNLVCSKSFYGLAQDNVQYKGRDISCIATKRPYLVIKQRKNMPPAPALYLITYK